MTCFFPSAGRGQKRQQLSESLRRLVPSFRERTQVSFQDKRRSIGHVIRTKSTADSTEGITPTYQLFILQSLSKKQNRLLVYK